MLSLEPRLHPQVLDSGFIRFAQCELEAVNSPSTGQADLEGKGSYRGSRVMIARHLTNVTDHQDGFRLLDWTVDILLPSHQVPLQLLHLPVPLSIDSHRLLLMSTSRTLCWQPGCVVIPTPFRARPLFLATVIRDKLIYTCKIVRLGYNMAPIGHLAWNTTWTCSSRLRLENILLNQFLCSMKRYSRSTLMVFQQQSGWLSWGEHFRCGHFFGRHILGMHGRSRCGPSVPGYVRIEPLNWNTNDYIYYQSIRLLIRR